MEIGRGSSRFAKVRQRPLSGCEEVLEDGCVLVLDDEAEMTRL